MRALLLITLLASTGCLRKTDYKCTDSAQCGAGGTCEDVGFCSFADMECDSGRRYAEHSGTTFSNRCVGDGSVDPDGGTDPDMATGDGSLGNCPATYSALAGITTRRYRVISGAADWTTQRSACAADGASAYLAIPDDQAELTAILAATSGDLWVGINDPADNEMFVTVKAAASFSSASALWAAGGEPDDNPVSGGGPNTAECVMALTASDRLADERCNETYAAVCECEP